MKKMLFMISVICGILSACMLFVCEVISETLPKVAWMLFQSFGGRYAPEWYQADFSTVVLPCLFILIVSVVAAVCLGIQLVRKEKHCEKSN